MKKFSLAFFAVLFSAAVCLVQPQPPDTLWTRTFGGSSTDYGYSVRQTSDGGFVIAGSTNSFSAGCYNVYLVKTDASGDEQWARTFGGSLDDYGQSLQQTSDGGYIIAGSTSSFGAGNFNLYLVKTDSSGYEQWARSIGGSGYDTGNSVQQTSDGGYIVAGTTRSFGAGGYDVYLVKTDSGGYQQWYSNFGESYHDYGNSVQQTSDGGYIIAGQTASFGACLADVYLVKADSSGNQQWFRTFGASGNDRSFCVQQTSDGGYIIAGSTESFGAALYDVYLVKTDALGVLQWYRTYGGCGDFSLAPAYPNPFNAQAVLTFQVRIPSEVSLIVHDLAGREVAVLINEYLSPGTYKTVFDGAGLPSGIYFARLSAGDFTRTQKLLLIK